MVSAKKTGIETENNLLSIAERVLSRSKAELKTTVDTTHDYEERNLRMAVSKRTAIIELKLLDSSPVLCSCCQMIE